MRPAQISLFFSCGLLIGCSNLVSLAGLAPERSVGGNLAKTVLPASTPSWGETAPGTYQKRISGHVYLQKSAGAYRVETVSQVPAAGASVQLRAFGQADVTLDGGAADANGAYALGTNDTTLPLFVMASVSTAQGPELLFAPVPETNAADVTVDLDLESTMIAQAYFDRAASQPDWGLLLDPKTITTLRARLDQIVTDQTAPDAHVPTTLYQAMDQLVQQDATLKATFSRIDAQASPLPSPSPLSSPHTITPDSPLPEPTTGDPPIFDGSGSGVTASPMPASYLGAAQTGLKQAGQMAAIRFTDLDAVFMAAVDHGDNSMLVLFRDDGSPTHLPASQFGLSALAGVALDKQEHLYALGGGELVRATMSYGPKAGALQVISSDPALAQADALALAPDGSAAYAGGPDGNLVKLALPAGTLTKTSLGGAIASLALAADGSVDAVLGTGDVVQLGVSGSVTKLASVPGATAITMDGSGRVFVGTKDDQMLQLQGAQATPYLTTASVVEGVAGLGGYVFLTEFSGNLDVVTTAQ